MRYIVSNISPGMFRESSYALLIDKIDYDEFYALSHDGGAYSCIGHKDISQLTGLRYNKEPVQARIGDELLLAQIYHGCLRFYYYRVVESEQPITHEIIMEA